MSGKLTEVERRAYIACGRAIQRSARRAAAFARLPFSALVALRKARLGRSSLRGWPEMKPTHLAAAIGAYQQKFDVDGKRLAREIGIEESSLTRLKQGRDLNADNFLKLMLWLMATPESR